MKISPGNRSTRAFRIVYMFRNLFYTFLIALMVVKHDKPFCYFKKFFHLFGQFITKINNIYFTVGKPFRDWFSVADGDVSSRIPELLPCGVGGAEAVGALPMIENSYF